MNKIELSNKFAESLKKYKTGRISEKTFKKAIKDINDQAEKLKINYHIKDDLLIQAKKEKDNFENEDEEDWYWVEEEYEENEWFEDKIYYEQDEERF